MAVVAGVLAVLAAVVLLRSSGGEKPPASLAAARLTGPFNMVERVTRSRGYSSLKPGTKDTMTWIFTPVCSSGPCSARVQFTVTSALNALNGQTATIKLRRSGRVYWGAGRAALSSCQLKSVFGPTRIRFRVTQGKWIGGAWTATRIAGTLTHSAPASSFGLFRCNPSGFTARIGGHAAG